MTTAYIGLGSNLENPELQIRNAVQAIKTIERTVMSNISALYYSRPMGPQDQPDYMNAVIQLETSLTAITLLDELQRIENVTGRVRKEDRWGPRILDLDILLYDNEVINSERLIVPHYGLKEREFVLIPLHEIAPHLCLPDGDTIESLRNNIPSNGLKFHSKLS
jgi:2-amino-4-hydroxy-6-hydroxymethyldihydropteridine diphosphokinase